MHLAFVFGTRPEVIKMAPVIHEAKKRGMRVTIVHTGQHTDLAQPLFGFFDFEPQINLNSMLERPSLTQLSVRVLERLDNSLGNDQVDCVVVQGDTTSAFVGAYWAFCRQIGLAHIEAGLRTWNLTSPFPEEANRQLIGRIARFHFTPTQAASEALIRENIPQEKIHFVGNTSIDSLHYTLERIKNGSIDKESLLPESIQNFCEEKKVITVTAHRRENHGPPLARICNAILKIADLNPECRVVVPVHPNPNVRAEVTQRLKDHARIMTCEPLGYVAFIQLMNRSSLLITDSGGVQEEAPSLRKPILVIRETTERPEGVQAGFAELVGTEESLIVDRALEALRKGCHINKENPYGDGKSAEKIISTLEGA